MSVSFPIWFLILLNGISIVLVFILHILIRIIKKKQVEKEELKWTSYKQDKINGYVWQWEYDKEKIINLTPLCPQCNMPLMWDGGSNNPVKKRPSKYECVDITCGYNIATLSTTKAYLAIKFNIRNKKYLNKK